MDLNTFLKRSRGRATKLAISLGLSPVLVSQWGSGERLVPIARCAAIERATGGQVTRRDLRPNDWHLIWPELADKATTPNPPDIFGQSSTATEREASHA